MSTSPQSSESATASLSSLYGVSNAADGIIYKQQQQPHPTSSVSQRFHPYLIAYGRDASSSLTTTTTPQSAAAAAVVDRDPSRGLQYVSDLLGPGTAGAAADSSYSGRRSHGHQTASSSASRRLREFIPDHKKDDEYWVKRQKNNEAAKRSREKRRIHDMVMTKKILELTTDNKRLRLELETIKRKYGLMPDTQYPVSDEVSADRSVSPVCVGISSSDDSTPPSSFAHYQSASRSSPSPPTLDRYYAEPSITRPNHSEGKVLQSQVSCASQEQYQPMDGYRHQLVGQQQHVLNPHLAMHTQQQHQQHQPQVPFSKSISSTETAALLRPFQLASTSAMPASKISYAQAAQPGSGDPGSDPVCGNPLFQSKLRNQSLPEDVLPPTQTHALASSASSGLVDDPHMPSGHHRVMASASELQSLAFSDLSSDDDEDEGGYRGRPMGSDAPLNLTKRFVPWPSSGPSMSSFSNSSYVVRQPVNSLRNDGDKSLVASFFNRELPLSPMTESSELRYWMHSSKELFENNPAAGSLSRPEEHLPNPTIRETESEISQRLLYTAAKSNTCTVVKLESGNGSSSVMAAKSLKESCDDGIEEPPVSSDLAVDTLDIQVQTPSRQVRGGVPLKVWHKRSALFAAARSVDFDQEDFQMSATTSGDISLIDDEDQTGALTALSPNSSPSSDSFVNYSSELSDSDSVQAKFRERRMRNSGSVRKSRESRKLLTDLNMTTATILESENHKLKEELRSLSREVTDLKEIIGKKDSRNGIH